MQIKLLSKLPQGGMLRSCSDKCQRGSVDAVLHRSEGTQQGRQIVQGLVRTGADNMGLQLPTRTVMALSPTNDIGDNSARNMVVGKHLFQELRQHNIGIGMAQCALHQTAMLVEKGGCPATMIGYNGSPLQQAANTHPQHSGHKAPIGRAMDMQHLVMYSLAKQRDGQEQPLQQRTLGVEDVGLMPFGSQVFLEQKHLPRYATHGTPKIANQQYLHSKPRLPSLK